MNSSLEGDATTARDKALVRVLEYRERGRRRAPLARVALAVVGAALLVAAVPLVVLLPEIGIPALLIGFVFWRWKWNGQRRLTPGSTGVSRRRGLGSTVSPAGSAAYWS